MKQLWLSLFITSFMTMIPFRAARADIFGGDDAILAQILVNALQELAQLRQILQSGESSLQLMQDINRGVNDSLNLAQRLSSHGDPGLYRDWSTPSSALSGVETTYGKVPDTQDAQVQRNNNQSTSEAIALNNSLYDFSEQVETIADGMNASSHSVSPGGAAKLTAQGVSIILNVLDQGLRAQATGLKLQAQGMAEQNRREKMSSENYAAESSDFTTAMGSTDTSFKVPRF